MEFHTRSTKFLMLKHIVGNQATEGVGRHAAVRRIRNMCYMIGTKHTKHAIYAYIYILSAADGTTVSRMQETQHEIHLATT